MTRVAVTERCQHTIFHLETQDNLGSHHFALQILFWKESSSKDDETSSVRLENKNYQWNGRNIKHTSWRNITKISMTLQGRIFPSNILLGSWMFSPLRTGSKTKPAKPHASINKYLDKREQLHMMQQLNSVPLEFWHAFSGHVPKTYFVAPVCGLRTPIKD